MTHFDEMSRRIQWSKIEFSHSLSSEPTPDGALNPHSRLTVWAARLSFCRCDIYAMKKFIVILVVAMLATQLPAPTLTLSISPLTDGNFQITTSGIENLALHQTVCVLQSTTDFVNWTSIITNRSALLPLAVTNIVNTTNPMTFYRASITFE
jgi:hypothetical protein